jgi:hypothetical protein
MDIAFWLAIAGAAVFAVVIGLRLFWRGAGIYKISRAGPRRIYASRHRIWRDPPSPAALDLASGPGGPTGVPVAPFTFLQEHTGGTQPCCTVRDARDRRWRVKWGHEVRCETFAVRLAWACGYFAEVTHFVPSGTIEGAANLQTTRECIARDGRFVEARFELDDPDVRKLFEAHSWAWNDNPFVGTRELDGLKIVVMLLSNWDTKDRRDVARGSNTAIFEQQISGWRREARYLISDWGGSMGRWGTNIVTRGRWDVDGFEAQTSKFVTGLSNGSVTFGYAGQRTGDIANGISVGHARWFYQYARRLTTRHLVDGLMASGATSDEASRFARAFLDRIEQIGRAARIE